MIPGAFEYHRPDSIERAIELLNKNAGAKVLAGGHSLLPMMKLRLAAPSIVVDIGALDELRFIRRQDNDLVIGALATHAEVAASAEVRQSHRGLAEAAAAIGDVQVRNCGTLAGSLAHADPAADYAAATLAFDAEITAVGPSGERTVAAADLFTGLLQTSLERNEIITHVRFPDSNGAASAYEKFAQPASGFAIVGIVAAVSKDGDGNCGAARVAVTGVASRPVRLSGLEGNLVGKPLDQETIGSACRQADADLEQVREDLYAGADYRRHLVREFARRALLRAAA